MYFLKIENTFKVMPVYIISLQGKLALKYFLLTMWHLLHTFCYLKFK